MINNIQNLCINVLNSKYRILFTLIIYSIIYLFFYGNKMICYCMNEQNVPSIAEAKPTRSMAQSIIQREVAAFAGFAETIEEQKSLLKTQQLYINDLEIDLKFSEEKNLPLKEDVKRITSKYLDQTFYVEYLKSSNQQLYSENVNLRRRILKLEEELKQLK